MTRVQNCLWLRSWIAEDGLTIGAVSQAPCEFDNTSARIYITGPEDWDGDENLAAEDKPDYEAVFHDLGEYGCLEEVVWENGKAYVGDSLIPFEEYEPLFHLG